MWDWTFPSMANVLTANDLHESTKSLRANVRTGVEWGMMRIGIICLLAVLVCGGCASTPHETNSGTGPMTLTDAKKLETRNNAVSLLYDLFQDEKNVNKVLIIKRNSAELGHLINAVAHTSGDAAKRLEAMAQADPHIRLHALELPDGEKATRASIARTKEHELLFSSGDNFAFQLLLTQTDALSYGWHLSKIAAENSTAPDEVRAFGEISGSYKDLYGQTLDMLKAEARKVP